MWDINKAFLDQQMAEGKAFVFTVDPRDPEIARSFTRKEWNYLKSNGYHIVPDEDGMYYANK